MKTMPSIHGRFLSACLSLAAIAAFSISASAEAQAPLPVAGVSTKVGAGLYELVYHPGTGDVFAATIGQRGADNGRIFVLDGETLANKGSIHTAGYVPYGLGLHEASGTLYASDTRNGVVIVADIASMEVVRIIENPADENGHLREVVVDQASGRVYVSSYNENGLIWVIDHASGQLVDTFLNVGNGTSGMALDPVNDRLFAANMAAGDITEIDLDNGEYVRRFSAGGDRPSNLEYDAGRGRLWSANQATNDATVIDVETGEVLAAVGVGDQALGIRYNPVNDMMYVTARRSGIVTAVDAGTMNVLTWMQTGSYPNTIVVNRSTGTAYVSNKARSAGRDVPPAFDPNGDTVTRLERTAATGR
ncbi:MAG: YncE family protein [Gemmatimonadota bacterium]